MNFFQQKFEDNLFELDNIIRGVLLSQGNFEDKSIKYRFKCQLCGDSSWSRKKMRGYILKKKEPWMYVCHNCGYQKPAVRWLQEHHPIEYDRYMNSVFTNDDGGEAELQAKLYQELHQQKIVDDRIQNYNEDKVDRQHFASILIDHPIAQAAREYCISRSIPEHIWTTWMVSLGGGYFNRMIIPYRTPENKVYYFQGRHLANGSPKYLFAKYRNENYYPIYNYYQINNSIMTPVIEGPIDSTFVENACAVGGIKPQIPGTEFINDKLYWLDLDDAGVVASKMILENGEKLFNWIEFVKDLNLPPREKWDINDVVEYTGIKHFSLSDINRYVIQGKFNFPVLEMFWNEYKSRS
jgi:predicted RNA-binding Zn-ribbon protein involved in translation (DUF1610 family)